MSLAVAGAAAPAPPPYMTPLIAQAQLLATHSWERGTLSEALLEWYDPQYAVFGDDPFPNGSIPRTDPNDVEGLKYAARHIRLDNVTLVDGDGSAGDPASLGVSAMLLGASNRDYAAAAQRQHAHLTTAVPRWPNGAISHRDDYPELWADFVAMAPPFLAYYAVATGDARGLVDAARQVELYADVLAVSGEGCACGYGAGGAADDSGGEKYSEPAEPGEANPNTKRQPTTSTTTPSPAGLWRHIVGPRNADPGLWSTGNAWASYGALRVLATLSHSPFTARARSAPLTSACTRLAALVKRILDAAICLDDAEPAEPLLRNYLNDSSWFGDAAGTALLAAAAYRAVVLDEATFPSDVYAAWADEKREAVEAVVDPQTGIVGSVVNPLGWGDRTPAEKSPEAQSFAIMMLAAYRDYVEKMGDGEAKDGEE
ncbi:hypothetical protein HDK90DRAFT_510210 [Phyllosticta capitalensis]|uniref:Uncharacterized protein n=1 Tax=Phyllosticta capitalensis TaxID=121624 RepID=A0ABR1YUM1_9PEZI